MENQRPPTGGLCANQYDREGTIGRRPGDSGGPVSVVSEVSGSQISPTTGEKVIDLRRKRQKGVHPAAVDALQASYDPQVALIKKPLTPLTSLIGRFQNDTNTMCNRLTRYAEAYVHMAKEARYRPKAPGDGFGNVSLSARQLADRQRLMREAADYARAFDAEEDERTFIIGCSEYDTNRALIYTVEAARVLCGCERGHGRSFVAGASSENMTKRGMNWDRLRHRGRATASARSDRFNNDQAAR